ncbi:hypothetical protein D3C74_110200 [compost metagenome]
MKKLGYVSFGLILGLALSVASPVFAQTVKSINAKINSSVSVVVHGEKVKLNAQPINYNNLNYLPVGEIGRALGMNVSYDKASESINIVDSNNAVNNSEGNSSVQTTSNDTELTNQTQQAEVYYKHEDIEKIFNTFFVGSKNDKIIIRVGGENGSEYEITHKKTLYDNNKNEYRIEEFYLQFLTKEQLNQFKKYTYDNNTKQVIPVN